MSFHWSLSSDEEEETEEWQSKLAENAALPTQVTPLSDQSCDFNVARMPTKNDAQGLYFSEEDDDNDEVDWEDAEEDDEGDGTKMDNGAEDTKMPALMDIAPKPVTIDMNPSTSSQPQKKKRKRTLGRKMYRFYSLPPHLQTHLLHIQQSHLLALSSRAVQLSQCCSNPELLHVAHSLIPAVEQNEVLAEVPTEAEVRQFVSWYMLFVNRVSQRRRSIRAANEAAGAPAMRGSKKRKAPSLDVNRLGTTQPEHMLQVASYLSSANDDHPDLSNDEMELSNQDKVQLLVAMAR